MGRVQPPVVHNLLFGPVRFRVTLPNQVSDSQEATDKSEYSQDTSEQQDFAETNTVKFKLPACHVDGRAVTEQRQADSQDLATSWRKEQDVRSWTA